MRKQKISEWLADLGSHSILDHEKCVADFTDKTGVAFNDDEAWWPSHTRQETVAAINARGLGGELAPDEVRLCYGYEVAEALAYRFARTFEPAAQGRGTRFRECLAALKAAGN